MSLSHRFAFVVLLLYCGLVGSKSALGATESVASSQDIIIVGAGIAGLSTAVEAGRHGARVLVIDMGSVFGGHAVMSGGDVTMIDTPLQRAKGIFDSPELAYRDFMAWGEDANSEWVRYYVENSRKEVFDWLTEMGVVFDNVGKYPGNSVPRAHSTRGLGLGLVRPVYRECLEHPNISFLWNTKVTDLIVDRGRVKGLHARNLRTGETHSYQGKAVILATGGFQSNLDLVRENWPADLRIPERLLAGSGVNSMGSGLKLATDAGAVLFNLDHQWNYDRGLPDPRFPGSNRGLNAGNGDAVWVNAQGVRFISESTSSYIKLRSVLQQHPATYWTIFDEQAKHKFFVIGTDWKRFETIERLVLSDPKAVTTANSIEELAEKMGLPSQTLSKTITKYNRMIAERDDSEFHGFGASATNPSDRTEIPPQIVKAPFYAAQFFPLTRKSMGGVLTDLSGHALDVQKHPVVGLFAVGEAAGLAGINGKAALEGTFLGPSVVTGRVAARTAVAEFHIVSRPESKSREGSLSKSLPLDDTDNKSCAECHHINDLLSKSREGYWHFEKVHRAVLDRNIDCVQCHTGMLKPSNKEIHKTDPRTQTQTCLYCHVSE